MFVAVASFASSVAAMNKAELIDAMATDAGLSKADAKRALDGFLSAVSLGLADGSRKGVFISGFGAFLRVRNEVCDAKDNDCNGRFSCSTDKDAGYTCNGIVCNGVDLNHGLDGFCHGYDNDCDLLVDDESLDDVVDFHADVSVENQMGKYVFNYWSEVILQLANELDKRSNKSYRCSDGTCRDSPVYVDDGLEGDNPLYGCGFMTTSTYWMTVMKDILDPDSDDDGLSVGEVKPIDGHVTVLKARLDEDLQTFYKRCSLSQELEMFVKEFMLQAADAIVLTNTPLEGMNDDRKAIMAQMSYELIENQRQMDFMHTTNSFRKRDKKSLVTSPEQVAKRALDSIVSIIVNAIKKGDRVSLVGFGSFSISKRAARTGRNPQTGKEIKIAAKKVVKFKAGADLSKKVN